MGLEIKKPTQEDLENFLPVIQEMFLEHDVAEPDLFNPNSFKPDQVKDMYVGLLNDESKGIFAAYIDGKLSGIVRAEIVTPPSFYKIQQLGLVDDLIVLQEYRKMGVGTGLMEAALNWLKEKKVEMVEVKIYEWNEKSQGLVTKLGFKKTFSYFYKKLTD